MIIHTEGTFEAWRLKRLADIRDLNNRRGPSDHGKRYFGFDPGANGGGTAYGVAVHCAGCGKRHFALHGNRIRCGCGTVTAI